MVFFLCWLHRGAIETLGAGRGYDVGGTEGGGGYLHPPTLRQAAIHLLRSLLTDFAGYPVRPGTFSKGTKKNHLYSNIPVIPFGKEGENTHLCHTTYTIHECKDKQHF